MTAAKLFRSARFTAVGATVALLVAAAALAIVIAPSDSLAQGAPGKVSNITLTRADGSLTATWDAPAGATKYHITYSSDNRASWSLGAFDHAQNSLTINGVNNDATYIVGIRAGNESGYGGWTNSSAVGPFVPDPAPTPVPPPNAPASITLTRADGSLTATWDAPNGATKYHITYSSDNRASWSLGAFDHAQNSLTINGVNNDATYIVGIRAGNESGYSGWTNSSAIGPFIPDPTPTPTPTPEPTPEPDPPTAPSSVTVTRGDDTISASWPAVSNATKYHITYSYNSKHSWTAASDNHTGTSITIDANNGKTYHVAVRAGNSAGWSGWTNSPASAPTATPGIIVQDSSGNAITALSVPEGGEATYQVKLASQPDSYVEICIGLSVRDRNDGSITFKGEPNGTVAIKVPFTPENWDTAQTVTLVAAEDDDAVNGVRDVINDTRDFVEYFSGAVWLAVTEIDNDPIPAPSNLSVTSGDGYLDIAWDAVTGATGYDVRAKASGSSTWTDVASSITTTSHRYTTDATIDYVGVRSRNANGPGPWAEISRLPDVDFVTNNSAAGFSMASAESGGQIASSEPDKPASVTLTRDNWPYDEKLFVTWSAVSGATGYNVVCSDKGGWKWWSCGTVSSSSTTTYTVDREIHDDINDDLEWHRSYRVAVQAVKNNVRGNWTDTEDAHPAFPPGIANPITATRESGSVTLTWTPPPHAQGYEIDCATRENNVSSAYTRCADVETATVTNGKINKTITSWTVSGTTYNIDNTKTYDIRVRTTNAWGSSTYSLAPLIYPNYKLTVSNIGVTTATLTVGNHTAQWWYKANAAPHTSCQGPVAANTATKDLTGLSAGTTYTYSMYSATGCADADKLATAQSFTTGVSVSNLSETSAASGLNLATDWGQEFTTGSAPGGYTLQSVTLDFALVAPSSNITVSIREQQSNDHPATTDKAALTGTPATGQVTFTCSGAGCNLDTSTTYFVFVDGNDIVSNMTSTTSNAETLQPSGNGWSIENSTRYQAGNWALHPQGVSMKVSIEALARPSLTATNVSSTGATLAISNQAADWYYKANTGPDNTCQGPVSGSSTTLSGLTEGTSYTYTAYSDSACSTTIAPSASFTTPLAAPTGLTATRTYSASDNSDTIALSWTAPSSSTGRTGYAAECSTDSGANWSSCGGTIGSSATSHTISGLHKGNSYVVRLRATGSGSAASAWVQSSSFAALSTPGTPTGLSMQSGWNASWTAPSNTGNGGGTVKYAVECKRATNTSSAGETTSTSKYVGGNQHCKNWSRHGNYFRVRAWNIVWGSWSGWHRHQ